MTELFNEASFFDCTRASNVVLQPVWGTVKKSDGSILEWSKTFKTVDHLDSFSRLNLVSSRIAKGFVSYNNSYGNLYHMLREWVAALVIFRHNGYASEGFQILLPNCYNGVFFADHPIICSVLKFLNLSDSVCFVDSSIDSIAVDEIIYPRVLSSCFYLNSLPYFGKVLADFSSFLIANSLGEFKLKNIKNARVGYLSRSDSKRRSIINESELAWHLHVNYRAEVFSISNRSLEEQIFILNQFDVLISPHGAGLANISFMLPDRASDFLVVEIMPRDYDHDFYKMISNERNFSYYKLYSEPIPDDTKGHDKKYSVDISQIDTFLKRLIF